MRERGGWRTGEPSPKQNTHHTNTPHTKYRHTTPTHTHTHIVTRTKQNMANAFQLYVFVKTNSFLCSIDSAVRMIGNHSLCVKCAIMWVLFCDESELGWFFILLIVVTMICLKCMLMRCVIPCPRGSNKITQTDPKCLRVRCARASSNEARHAICLLSVREIMICPSGLQKS